MVLTLAVYGYVLPPERHELSSIGFHQPRLLNVVLAVIAGVLMVAGIVAIYGLVLRFCISSRT